MINNSQYIGEPSIIDGDLVKNGGDYQRNYGIDNMIYILVGTDSDYWGNLIEPVGSKIPGGLEKLDAEAITSTFLARHSAAVELALSPLITNQVASSVKVESFNPSADRIEWTSEIVMKDQSKYFFDSESGTGSIQEA